MKINRPTRFYPENGGMGNWNEINADAAMDRATLISRGDVLRRYAATDSQNPEDWHAIEDTKNDSWVKFSFDGGKRWLLKFRYKNTLLMKFYKPGTANKGERYYFDFSNYGTLDYSSIRNGRISLYAVAEIEVGQSTEEWLTTLSNYRYMFDDNDRKLYIYFTMALPADTSKIMLLIELDGHSAMAMAVPTSVYTQQIGIAGMIYDEQFGYVGELAKSTADNGNIQLRTNTPLSNTTELTIKLQSADEGNGGDVSLTFQCGDHTWTRVLPVTTSAAWRTVELPVGATELNGDLTITRNGGDTNDTLQATCYVLDIKATAF